MDKNKDYSNAKASRERIDAPSGLRLLAKWFDAESILLDHEIPNSEKISTDLRRWADIIEDMVEKFGVLMGVELVNVVDKDDNDNENTDA